MNSELNINKLEIKEKLKSISASKSEQQQIERESLILQANFLSEIERLYKNGGLNRKELAAKINTSASYLTQVFRGDKPLNFLTLAKIKRALGLQFEVQASFNTEKKSKNAFVFDALAGNYNIDWKDLENRTKFVEYISLPLENDESITAAFVQEFLPTTELKQAFA